MRQRERVLFEAFLHCKQISSNTTPVSVSSSSKHDYYVDYLYYNMVRDEVVTQMPLLEEEDSSATVAVECDRLLERVDTSTSLMKEIVYNELGK